MPKQVSATTALEDAVGDEVLQGARRHVRRPEAFDEQAGKVSRSAGGRTTDDRPRSATLPSVCRMGSAHSRSGAPHERVQTTRAFQGSAIRETARRRRAVAAAVRNRASPPPCLDEVCGRTRVRKLARDLGVSEVARAPGGFVRVYQVHRSRHGRLPASSTLSWGRKRDNFVRRHMAQYAKHPTFRRWLALVMWAYPPLVRFRTPRPRKSVARHAGRQPVGAFSRSHPNRPSKRSPRAAELATAWTGTNEWHTRVGDEAFDACTDQEDVGSFTSMKMNCGQSNDLIAC